MRKCFTNVFVSFPVYFLIELGLRSILDSLVLKNLAECTSRRVNRTSGARVSNLCFSVGRLVVRKDDGRTLIHVS